MQNLLLKSVVLTGVIGVSCFVVWLANENLQKKSSDTDPNEFAAIEQAELAPDGSETEILPEANESVTSGLLLSVEGESALPPARISEAEIEPTLAKSHPFAPLRSDQIDTHVKPRSLQMSEFSNHDETPRKFANSPSGPSRFPEEKIVSGDEPQNQPHDSVMPLIFYAAGGNDVPKVTMSLDETKNLPTAIAQDDSAPILPPLENSGFETENPSLATSTPTPELPGQNEMHLAGQPVPLVEKPAILRFGPSVKSETAPAPQPSRLTFETRNENENTEENSESSAGRIKLATAEQELAFPNAPSLADRTADVMPIRSEIQPVSAEEDDSLQVQLAGDTTENPFARFKPPTANSKDVLPIAGSAPDNASNPFEKFQPKPLTTAALEPVEPSSIGFNTPAPQPSVPSVASDPFGNQALAAVPERVSVPHNQPVPEDLLPPLDSPILPLGGNVANPRPLAFAPQPPLVAESAEAEPVLPGMVEPLPLLPSTVNSTPIQPWNAEIEEESVLPAQPRGVPAVADSKPFPMTADEEILPTAAEPPISVRPMAPTMPVISSRPNPAATRVEPPTLELVMPEPLPTVSPIRDPSPVGKGSEFPGAPQVPAAAPISDQSEDSDSVLPFDLQPHPVPTPVVNMRNMPMEVAEPTAVDPPPIASAPNRTNVESVGPSQPVPFNAIVGNGTIDPAIPSNPQSPELKIEKIAPAEASIGEPLIYAIRIRNVGGSDARSVVVEDRIPRGTRLEGTIPQAVLTDDLLSWDLGKIPPGEERTIQLKVTPLQAGDIGSVAKVTFEAAVSTTIRVTAPELSVEIDGPTETLLGKNVPYKFTVRNTGQGDAKDVVLRAILPPSLKHPNGNDIEADLETIPAGQSRTVELVVVADEVGVSTPKVLIWMDGKDIAENRADLRILESRIRISRTGPQRRFVGRSAEFVTQVTNDSSIPLTNLSIIEQLPVSVDLAAFINGWDPQRRVIQRSISVLQPGETKEFTTQIIPNQAGEVIGKLTVQDTVGNRADLSTPLSVKGFAELEADVQGENKIVAVGEQVSFRLNLKNDGTASATNVRASFEIPQGLSFATATGPSSYQLVDNRIVFDLLQEMPTNTEKNYDIVLTASEVCNTKVKVALQSADYEQPIHLEEPVRVISDLP